MAGSSPSHCSELDPGHINHITHDRHSSESLLVANLGAAKVKEIPLTTLARCWLSYMEINLTQTCSLWLANLFLILFLKGSEKDYKLWVISGREDAPYPLIGKLLTWFCFSAFAQFLVLKEARNRRLKCSFLFCFVFPIFCLTSLSR